MRWTAEISGLCAALALAACGMVDGRADAPAPKPARLAEAPPPTARATAPAPESKSMGYDEVGYASWYGEELLGNKTATGEMFDPKGVSAAHRTLPLESFAEVTALDSGRTILVRVNDRGPFHGNRLIDLSTGAAQQLGVAGGHFPVRVRRVSPPEQEQAVLKRGERAAERLATPPVLLAVLRGKLKLPPAPDPKIVKTAGTKPATKSAPPRRPEIAENSNLPLEPQDATDGFVVEQAGRKPSSAPAATGAGLFIQVATFSSSDRAAALAKRIGGRSIAAGNLWRVRKGPFASEIAARRELAEIMNRGYRDARLTR